MKFKVGDRVLVKRFGASPDDPSFKIYTHLKDKICTVVTVYSDGLEIKPELMPMYLGIEFVFLWRVVYYHKRPEWEV